MKMRLGHLGIGVFLSVVFGSTSGAYAQARAPKLWTPPEEGDAPLIAEMQTPLDETLAADVEVLVEQLGAPSYQTRVAARTRLMDIGPRAFMRLWRTRRETDELEVQLQIESIVRESYLNYFVFGRNAFLGISQDRFPATNDTDLRIQKGHVGIKIAKIIPGTAAEAAGIKKGDIIAALNGEPVPEATGRGIHPNTRFGEAIRVHGPGARVELTVLRGRDTLEMSIILGSRPKAYYRRQGIVSEMLNYYKERYDRFLVQQLEGEAVENVDGISEE